MKQETGFITVPCLYYADYNCAYVFFLSV